MNLINYNKETGNFKLTLQTCLSEHEINLLRLVGKEKNVTFESLKQMRHEAVDDDAFDEVMHQVHTLSALKDFALIEESHIYKDGKIEDWCYRLTHYGNALLHIIDGKKKD